MTWIVGLEESQSFVRLRRRGSNPNSFLGKERTNRVEDGDTLKLHYAIGISERKANI